MKKHIFTICCLLATALSHSYAQSSSVIKAYIEKYRDIAMEEMLRTGVPASITLAQGIHETGAGTSDLVLRSNNHFGIKCKTEWTGQKVYHDDDARGECFRKYDDPIQSYKDHSDFLKYRPYYAALFKLDPLDYKGWAYGLKKAGYATNPRYPQILIKIIEDYNLQEYSLMALNGKRPDDDIHFAKATTENSETEQEARGSRKALRSLYPSGIFRINETRVILVTEGTSYLKIAEENGLSLARLFEFNDMQPEDVASTDRLIFLQRKRKTGEKDFHVVEEGETLYDIAQKEGVRLESIMEYNMLEAGIQLKAGEKILLKGKSAERPLLAVFKKENKEEAIAENMDKDKVQQEAYFIHTVQPKETAYSISRKYGVTIEELLEWNNLQHSRLSIGQELRIKKTNE